MTPARYSAVRADLAALHQVPAGLTLKTLRNHKSNVKAALLWMERVQGVPRHGAPLTVVWEKLRVQVNDSVIRMRLSTLMRFCSAKGIEPTAVDESVIETVIGYRLRMGKAGDNAFRRLLARAWNSCHREIDGWPAIRLIEPLTKSRVEIGWERFPEGLRQDADRYLSGLTKIRRSRTGQRIRPLRVSTIGTRRAELTARGAHGGEVRRADR